MVSHDQTFPPIMRSRLLLGVVIAQILQRSNDIVRSQHRPVIIQQIMERIPIVPTEIPHSSAVAIQSLQLSDNIYKSCQSVLR